MLPERDLAYLVDIRNAILKAQEYCAGITYDGFLGNELLQNAVIRMLTIIGEAATKLSTVAKQEVTGVAWEDITGMRNRLVHEYFRVNLAVIWETVQHDLPDLLSSIEHIVPGDR